MREGYRFLCGASPDTQGVLCFRRAAGEARLEGLEPQKSFILCLCLNGQACVLHRLNGRGGILPFSADPAWAAGNMVLLSDDGFHPVLWEHPLSPSDREVLWTLRKKTKRHDASDAACAAAEKQRISNVPERKSEPDIPTDHVPAGTVQSEALPDAPPHAPDRENAHEAFHAPEPVLGEKERIRNDTEAPTTEESRAAAAAPIAPAWHEYPRKKTDGENVFPMLPDVFWPGQLAAYRPYFEHGAPEAAVSSSVWRFVRVAADGKQGIDSCLLGRHTAGSNVDAVSFLIDETQVRSPQALQGYSRQQTAEGKGYYVLTLRAD